MSWLKFSGYAAYLSGFISIAALAIGAIHEWFFLPYESLNAPDDLRQSIIEIRGRTFYVTGAQAILFQVHKTAFPLFFFAGLFFDWLHNRIVRSKGMV